MFKSSTASLRDSKWGEKYLRPSFPFFYLLFYPFSFFCQTNGSTARPVGTPVHVRRRAIKQTQAPPTKITTRLRAEKPRRDAKFAKGYPRQLPQKSCTFHRKIRKIGELRNYWTFLRKCSANLSPVTVRLSRKGGADLSALQMTSA